MPGFRYVKDLACRRAGRVILRFGGGGICSLTGFFLKLNWIFFETQLGCIFGLIGGLALPLCVGARAAPFLLHRSGLALALRLSPHRRITAQR